MIDAKLVAREVTLDILATLFAVLVAIAVAAWAGGCGGDEGTVCGPGTVPVDGVCTVVGDGDVDGDGDSDTDGDSDADADADDAGVPAPCGWGTVDLDCDGGTDLECIPTNDGYFLTTPVAVRTGEGQSCGPHDMVSLVFPSYPRYSFDRVADCNSLTRIDMGTNIPGGGCQIVVAVAEDPFRRITMSGTTLVQTEDGVQNQTEIGTYRTIPIEITLWECGEGHVCPAR